MPAAYIPGLLLVLVDPPKMGMGLLSAGGPDTVTKETNPMAKRKYVYFFGGGKAEGKAEMKGLLGGKGANLAEMTNIGLPVPPGFTLSTEACEAFSRTGGKWPEGLARQIDINVAKLEALTGKQLGGTENPLLVSVRSGAAVSMPGMMDTVLNLGLNPDSLQALINKTGNPRFAWDAYRRFIQMFGDVVMGLEHHQFEERLCRVKRDVARRNGIEGADSMSTEEINNAIPDTDLDVGDLQQVVMLFKEYYGEQLGEEFPSDPKEQLAKSINAVFGSWDNPRAVRYREINEIRGLLGTAVNVQTMVFGNMGQTSGTGVCFTRDPSTGENKFYGEFLMNAQGEDVVAGIRTPMPIEQLGDILPDCYKELIGVRGILERHYREMEDLEFTIEEATLYILQTRSGKRTGPAAVQIAVDMVAEKLISRDEALLRVPPNDLDQLLHPMFDPAAEAQATVMATGLPASPGAATGQIVFSADDAEEWAKQGRDVILCRIETSPEDIGGMHVSRGILTTRGGMTSHAAVVARGMGTCCVAGAGGIAVDYGAKTLRADDTVLNEGDWISLNGTRGTVYAGQVTTRDPELTGAFGTVMEWADKARTLQVRTNADTPHDAEVAVRFGAEGIGLCRTEHMFFEGSRIISFRRLILVAEEVKTLREQLAGAEGAAAEQIQSRLAGPLAQYEQALDELLPLQRSDFEGIFEALQGRPCTIRLLDPPLHEFLPQDEEGQREMAETMGVSVEGIREVVNSLHEFNPMLGHRGCRLGLIYPEVSDMQVRAIIEAAINVKRNKGIDVRPEIMVPLVGNVAELRIAREAAEKVIAEVFERTGATKKEIPYLIGTMIEVPRAAVTADQIAEQAEFFSFGTNDMTQMGCGFSRDDAGKFLKDYVRMGVYDYDPFQVLDADGVGRLLAMGVEGGRATRPKLKVGICGEHGGEPRSVRFCHKVGLNYVSCSPYRVPIARLAAAQAAVGEKMAKRAAPKKPAKRKPAKRKAAKKKVAKRKVARKKVAKKTPKKTKAKKRPAKKKATKKRTIRKKTTKKKTTKKKATKKRAKKSRRKRS
jgi:pyruvate,orthophosphate dikinase